MKPNQIPLKNGRNFLQKENLTFHLPKFHRWLLLLMFFGVFLSSQTTHAQCTTDIHTGDFVTADFITACGTSQNLYVELGTNDADWYYSNDGSNFTTVTSNSNFTSISQSGYYKAFVSCSQSFTSVVEVNFMSADIPVIQEGTFITTCAGNSPSLNVNSSALGHYWEFKPNGGGFSQIAGNQPMITANQAGDYRVRFITGCNLGFSSVTEVQFISAPTINEGTFISVCAGNAPNLSTQTGAIGYNWQFSTDGGNTFTSIGGNSASIAGSSSSDGIYKVGAVYNCGTIFSTVTQVFATVTPIPVISQGAFISVCSTGNLSTNTSAQNYRWSFSENNTAFSTVGSNSTQLSFSSAGFYRVDINNGCGWEFSSVTEAQFLSVEIPMISSQIPMVNNFITACNGFDLVASEIQDWSNFQWQRSEMGQNNFVNISTQNTTFITTSGDYRLSAQKTCGAEFSSVVQVDFVTAPVIQEGSFITSCLSNPPTLNVQNPKPNTNYNWLYSSDNGNTFSTALQNSAFVSATNEGIYKAVGFYTCGNLESETTEVQFTSSAVVPIIQEGQFYTACGVDSLGTNLQAQTYEWHYSTDNVNFATVGGNWRELTFNTSGFYRVKAEDGCGWAFSSVTEVQFISAVNPVIQEGAFMTACITNPPVLHTQNGQNGYVWEYRPNPTVGFNTVGNNLAQLSVNQAGEYRVKFLNGCQNLFSSVTEIQFISAPKIQEGAFISACLQAPKPVLHADSGAVSYQWQFRQESGNFADLGLTSGFISADVAGFYRVGVDYGCGTQFTSATLVEFVTAVKPVIQEAPFISGCPDTSVTLHVNGSGAMQWQKIIPNGLDFQYFDIPNATSSTIDIFANGSYRVIFTSAGGCNSQPSDPIEVQFISSEQPLIQTDAIDPYAYAVEEYQQETYNERNGGQKWQVAVCNGGSIELKTETGAQQYQWFYTQNWNENWIPIPNSNSSVLTVTNSQRRYKVQVTRPNGCPRDSRPIWVMRSSGNASQPILEQNSPMTLQSGEAKMSTTSSSWRNKWQYAPDVNQPFVTVAYDRNDYKYDWKTRKYHFTARKAGLYRIYNTNGCETLFSTVIEVLENQFNDPPNFKISEQWNWFSIANDIGKHQRNNFITSIDDGDSDLEQNVTFFVTAQKPELFDVQPTINENGQLCFTPNPNTGGYTYIEIYAKDDGANNAPNNALSTPQRCWIWIMPKNYVFYDLNNNGTYEKNTEYPAIQRGVKVRKKSSWNNSFYNWTTSTMNDGSYYAYVYPTNNGAGYYKFEPKTSDYPNGATFTPAFYEDANVTERGYLSGKHFAVETPQDVEDVSTRIMSWWDWNSRPGFTTYYYIKYQNDGTKPKSGVVSFEYDDLLTFEDWYENNWYSWWGEKPLPNKAQLLANTNNTLSWTFSNLNPGESRYIIVKVRIQRPTANRNLLGETMYCTSKITPSGVDNDLANNKYIESRIISGSYDPNDKRVLPEGDVPPEFVENEELLTYRVRFQNSGTDTAFNVRVEDQLAEELDWESIEMLGASHDYRFEIDSTGKAIWYFDNILLPDDKVDEPGSHGQFEYQVKIKNDNSVNFGDKFGTKSYIYFDYNTAIITNQSDTRIWADLVAPQNKTLSPANGANGVASSINLYIEFDEQIKTNQGKLYILQADGTLLQTIDIQSDKVNLTNSTLQITPENLLPANGRIEEDFEVYVLMDYGTVIDLATNQHIGIQDKNTWRFTIQGQSETTSSENNNDNVTASDTEFILPVPDAPTGVETGSVSASSVELEWQASEILVDNYQIYRKTENGEFELIGTTQELTFVDENVEANTLYEYKIVASNNGGEAESNSLEIRTLPANPVMNTPEVSICEGSETVLVASGTSNADTLNWYFENEETVLATGSSITVNKAGNYFVALFQNGQESEKVSAEVTVNEIPTANIKDGERTFCGAGKLEAESVSGASYSWKNANGEEVGKSQKLTVSVSGSYSVTVEKNGCSAISEVVSVTINPSDLTAEILDGDNISFCESGQISAQPLNGAVYHWTKQNEELSETSNQLQVSESGVYALQISKNGCYSNTARISVKIVSPETPELRASETEIYEGHKTTLRTDYLKDASLEWYKNGEKIEGRNQNRLTVTEAGNYSVKAVYKAGCETVSETISIGFKDKPTINFVDGELTISGIENEDNIFSIQWIRDGKNIYGFDGTPTENGVYTVVIVFRDGTKISLAGVEVTGVVLGLEDENRNGLDIYPNPTSGVFTVSAKNEYLGYVQITITDMTGRTIFHKEIKKTSQTMSFQPNVNDWSKGAYHLKVQFGDLQIVRTIIRE